MGSVTSKWTFSGTTCGCCTQSHLTCYISDFCGDTVFCILSCSQHLLPADPGQQLLQYVLEGLVALHSSSKLLTTFTFSSWWLGLLMQMGRGWKIQNCLQWRSLDATANFSPTFRSVGTAGQRCTHQNQSPMYTFLLSVCPPHGVFWSQWIACSFWGWGW